MWFVFYFYTNNQSYFKQFSLAQVNSFIVKKIYFNSVWSNSSNSNNSVNWSLHFVNTQLNVKTILSQKIQFGVSSFNVENSSIQTIQFRLSTQFISI